MFQCRVDYLLTHRFRDLVPAEAGSGMPIQQTGGSTFLVPSIPAVERAPRHAQFPQRCGYRQLRVFDPPDGFQLLRSRLPHISLLPESTTFSVFFQKTILQQDFGHRLLQLLVLLPQLGDFTRRRFPLRIPGQSFPSGLEKLLTPAVVQIRRNPFASAQGCDALFSSQPFQHDPDLLLGRVLLSSLSTNLPHSIVCRHFLLHSILRSGKCLLVFQWILSEML